MFEPDGDQAAALSTRSSTSLGTGSSVNPRTARRLVTASYTFMIRPAIRYVSNCIIQYYIDRYYSPPLKRVDFGSTMTESSEEARHAHPLSARPVRPDPTGVHPHRPRGCRDDPALPGRPVPAEWTQPARRDRSGPQPLVHR